MLNKVIGSSRQNWLWRECNWKINNPVWITSDDQRTNTYIRYLDTYSYSSSSSSSSSSCIDIIFTSQPNFIIRSGGSYVFKFKLSYQIIFANLIRKLHNLHLIKLIRRAINEFNWLRTFLNTNVNEKVEIFNSAILNIFSNFIPQEFAVCDHKTPTTV